MHICVGNLTIIGSGNGLSPGRRQAIIWTNARILSIGTLGNFNEISIGIQTFSFKKMHFKMSAAKWRPFAFGLNVLIIAPSIQVFARLPALYPIVCFSSQYTIMQHMHCLFLFYCGGLFAVSLYQEYFYQWIVNVWTNTAPHGNVANLMGHYETINKLGKMDICSTNSC